MIKFLSYTYFLQYNNISNNFQIPQATGERDTFFPYPQSITHIEK